jgi:hypothetical protein
MQLSLFIFIMQENLKDPKVSATPQLSPTQEFPLMLKG